MLVVMEVFISEVSPPVKKQKQYIAESSSMGAHGQTTQALWFRLVREWVKNNFEISL